MMKEFVSIEGLTHAPAHDIIITEDLIKPTSLNQQRLWFLSKLEPELSSYTLGTALRLVGQLNQTTLEQSLNEILRRHDLLRTTFTTEDNELIQVIAPHSTLLLELVDLSNLASPQSEAEARCLIAIEMSRPFDLIYGPLLRATLFRLSLTDHILLLTLHRLIADDESALILQQELVAHYTASNAGQTSPLAELPGQYGSFALEQHELLTDPALAPPLAYWKQQLSGDLPLAALPFDHPRPPVQTFHADRLPLHFSPALTETLLTLSQQENVGLFTTLLTALKVLLFRYGGQEDILVGTTISYRQSPEWQQLIGPLENSLVLRSQVSDQLTFRALLQQVHETTASATAHQEIPFEHLIEALQPKRDLSHNPLFQVMFNLHEGTPQIVTTLPGLTISTWPVENKLTLADLSLSLLKTAAGLEGWLTYNADLFDAPTLKRMRGHLETLLASIAANPNSPIGLLPLLTEAEK